MAHRGWLVCLWLCPALITGLFEDQAFKFDWSRTWVGVPTQGQFWDTSRGQSFLLVRTKSHVLASLDADSGQIAWRQLLDENTDALLDMKALEKSVQVVSSHSGGAYMTFRSWHPASAALQHEVTASITDLKVDAAFVAHGEVTVLTLEDSGAVKVAVFDWKRGSHIRSLSLTSGAGERLSCLNTQGHLVCFSQAKQMVFLTSLPLAPKAAFTAVSLAQIGLTPGSEAQRLAVVPGSQDLVQISSLRGKHEDTMLLKLADGQIKRSQMIQNSLKGKNGAVFFMTGCEHTDDVLVMEQECADPACVTISPNVKVTKWRDFSQNVHEMVFEYPQDPGRVVNAWGSCDEDERGGAAIFQLALLTEDGSLTSITPLANQMWRREEALASIVKVELVSTGLSRDALEDDQPFQNDGKDLVQQFLRRIRHHVLGIQSTLNHLMVLKDWKYYFIGNQDNLLDDFGFRKVILAVSDEGKIFGLDNKNGDVLWSRIYPNVKGEKIYLFIQRSPMHFGTEPLATVIFKNRFTQKFQLITLDPLSGTVEETTDLWTTIDQAILLHHHDEQFIRPILAVSGTQVEVIPSSSKPSVTKYAGKTFMATLDPQTQEIQGQRLVVNQNGFLVLRPIWSLSNPGTQIQSLVGKATEEVVHSQGRVMADRSVLFKYINPNLALVITEGRDATGRSFINVYLLDMVTGRVVFSANHKRVTGPYHVVHSENWAVYTYYNEKSRRAEMTSLELFEGQEQSNATVFSSVADTISPLVERQSFILGPAHISAMKDTLTEKGITTKHILMATKTGAVYDVPRQFLDPRRPNINTPPEMREPGIPPYIPELQLPQEMIINYNQTIGLPRGIETAPTGLESTSVVFVYGLDLYCARVAPSKGFDLLKDDFDYYVIASVLFALIAASFITKRLSQRKALKQAWK